jgi:hypothetical protein
MIEPIRWDRIEGLASDNPGESALPGIYGRGIVEPLPIEALEGLPAERAEDVDSPFPESAALAIYREGVALEVLLQAGIALGDVAPISGLQTPEEMEEWVRGEDARAQRAARSGFGVKTDPRDLKLYAGEPELPDEPLDAVPIHALSRRSTPEELELAERFLRADNLR